MQTNNSWEDPVVTKVNSLQDLGKLVSTPTASATVASVSVTTTEEKPMPKVYKVTRGNRNPQLQAAMAYAETHPEELIKDVAAKFNVSKQSLYSLRYDMRTQQGASIAERKITREESLARAHAVRKAKSEQNRIKRELEKEVRKKLKAEAKQAWKQSTATTSNKPLIERDAEGYRLIEVGGRTARMLADRVVPKEDMVNHPAHYKAGGIETIDFIEAKNLNYNLGNVVKYVTRAKLKGSMLQDLEKAAWYLNREIETLKK